MADQQDRIVPHGIVTDLDSHLGELISFRILLDRLAQEDGQDGSLGGLSYWLQRIIDDFEEMPGQLQDLLSEQKAA